MRKVKIAATQMSCTEDSRLNREKAERLVRSAAGQGANIILLQELYQTKYFCQDYEFKNFEFACDAGTDEYLENMCMLARELDVVLPVSFFEKDNNNYFNSVLVIDADGSRLGTYRKIHIPDDMGYFEKFYFSPGDNGIDVWETKFGKIGIGICWDQWYPEVARILALQGAEMIFYPTAIGFHTNGFTPSSAEHWQLTMRGHSAANMLPVVASNRIGIEKGKWSEIKFFGKSFITDGKGNVLEELDEQTEGVIIKEFDLDKIEETRRNFVLFRDRRPEVYEKLLTLTGK